MRPDGTRIYLNKSLFRLSLIVFRELGHNKFEVLSQGEYKEFNETDLYQIPSTIDLNMETGNQLMDQLWNAGFRPSEGVSSQGQDKAREEHIKDLRNIIYSLLNIK